MTSPPRLIAVLAIHIGALFSACLLFQGFASAQTAGLVAAYSFNEGTGSAVADSSGNSNTGAVNGPSWTSQGRYGNALSFDGVNDRIQINASASLGLSSAMTIEAWAYPASSQSGFRTIVEREGNAYVLHASNSSGPLRPLGGGVFGGVLTEIDGPNSIPVNTWTHLAVTYDGSNVRLYVNGVQVASQGASGTVGTSSDPLWIGGNNPYGAYFNGRIDEVRIYNRALSQNEIQTDMSTPIGAAASSPSCDLNLDGSVNVGDVQLCVNMVLGITPCTANITSPGVCDVVVVQRVVNAAVGLTCVTDTPPPPPPPIQHTVSLNWTASSSPNVSGHNIYRATTSGGPYTKRNSSLVAATAYTDNTVSSGQTYYYVVTAVNSSGLESSYSNSATAVIPSP